MKVENLTPAEIQEAISEGVARGIMRLVRNGTDMPCADFLEAVRKGSEEGMYRFAVALDEEDAGLATAEDVRGILSE